MADKFERDHRGFKIYGMVTDSYESEIQVKESSGVGRPKVWVFAYNDPERMKNPSPHLTVEQAKELIKVLEEFIRDAEDPSNWRNDPEYIENFG